MQETVPKKVGVSQSGQVNIGIKYCRQIGVCNKWGWGHTSWKAFEGLSHESDPTVVPAGVIDEAASETTVSC